MRGDQFPNCSDEGRIDERLAQERVRTGLGGSNFGGEDAEQEDGDVAGLGVFPQAAAKREAGGMGFVKSDLSPSSVERSCDAS